MERSLWLLGVLIAALLGVIIVAVPFYGLVLLIPLPMVILLTFGMAGMSAALCAAWTGNLLDPKRAQSRLLPVVGVSEATAAVLALLSIGLVMWLQSLQTSTSPFLLPGLLISCAVVILLSATAATWRFRAPRLPLGRDLLLTLGLMGMSALILIWGIAAAIFLSQTFL